MTGNGTLASGSVMETPVGVGAGISITGSFLLLFLGFSLHLVQVQEKLSFFISTLYLLAEIPANQKHNNYYKT